MENYHPLDILQIDFWNLKITHWLEMVHPLESLTSFCSQTSKMMVVVQLVVDITEKVMAVDKQLVTGKKPVADNQIAAGKKPVADKHLVDDKKLVASK